MFDLVVGSGNAHKVAELRALLPHQMFRLTSLAELDASLDVEETGATFAENARLKATVQARHLGRWVLAEDSGLEVDALGGRPGVISARYAGRHGDDAANNRKLIEELDGVPLDRRTASFRCFVCVAAPDGSPRLEVDDACRGRIGDEPSGSGGFGYDPLFLIPEYHQTFGQLGATIKNVLCHRSRALRRLLPGLVALALSEGVR
jgi:XTP/dITP diphosphohydrolase